MTHFCNPIYPFLQQIAAEARGAPPCRPGFSEDLYTVVVPDITEEGWPLFNGEWRNNLGSVSCRMMVASGFECVFVLAFPSTVPASVCYISGGGSEQG